MSIGAADTDGVPIAGRVVLLVRLAGFRLPEAGDWDFYHGDVPSL